MAHEVMACKRVVLVPFPAQGHMSPMLQLGSLLHSQGFSITVAHSGFNPPNPCNYPDFVFLPISDELPGHDTSINNLLPLIEALNENCKAPLQESLMKKQEPHDEIACIIYDSLMYFSEAVATHLKLPSIILQTSSASYILACRILPQLQAEGYLPSQEPSLQDLVPKLHPMRFKDLPITNFETFLLELLTTFSDLRTSSAIIWNTVDCLEQSSLSRLQQHYQVPLFSIGPLHKTAPASSTSLLKEETSCIAWLDRQAPKSVIYVSLGSLATMEEKELTETAWGLANSNQPFLWVVRPSSVNGSDWIELLPEGFKEIIGERGLIVKWVPQKKVLAHGAVGGFWSHCGWNSSMESIYEGVPMICRPCFGDQKANARYLTHVWKVGLELEYELERRSIEKAIRRLLKDKEGEEMRQRAMDMKGKVEVCVQKGGSSYNSLIDLAEFISDHHNDTTL